MGERSDGMHGSYLILCTLSLKSDENQLKFHTVLMVPTRIDIQFNQQLVTKFGA